MIHQQGNSEEEAEFRHLDVPAETNRDKLVNFVAGERLETDPSDDRSVGRFAQQNASIGPAKNKRKFSRRDPNNER